MFIGETTFRTTAHVPTETIPEPAAPDFLNLNVHPSSQSRFESLRRSLQNSTRSRVITRASHASPLYRGIFASVRESVTVRAPRTSRPAQERIIIVVQTSGEILGSLNQ